MAEFREQAAAEKLHRDGIANSDLIRIAENLAGGIGSDGVAALQELGRIALPELKAKTSKAFVSEAEEAFGADGECLRAILDTQARGSDSSVQIERTEADLQRTEALAFGFEAVSKAETKARS